MNRLTLARVVQALVALIALVSITVIVTSDTGPDGTHRTTTVHIGAKTLVDNADQDAKANDAVPLTKSAQGVAELYAAKRFDLKGNLRGKDKGPIAKLAPPYAADEISGCRTRFLKTNWSSRTVPQSKVVLFWLHFSGGPDKPGTRSEVDGLTAYGNSPAARVSWHFNMDKDGNCDYNVPLRYKAWTEANANSSGISIEVAGTGSGDYLRPGGLHELAVIIHEVHQAYSGITLRLGAISNCVPTRGGIFTHWLGGPCSGGHTDIKPHDVRAVIADLAAETARIYKPRPVTPTSVVRSHTILHAKIRTRCHKHPRPAGCTLLYQRLGALHAKYPKLPT